MPFLSFDGRFPQGGRDCFIADSAELVGDVTLGDHCYVGFGTILRADYGGIMSGEEAAVEEGWSCHARSIRN